jgi:hypothetical protein
MQQLPVWVEESVWALQAALIMLLPLLLLLLLWVVDEGEVCKGQGANICHQQPPPAAVLPIAHLRLPKGNSMHIQFAFRWLAYYISKEPNTQPGGYLQKTFSAPSPCAPACQHAGGANTSAGSSAGAEVSAKAMFSLKLCSARMCKCVLARQHMLAPSSSWGLVYAHEQGAASASAVRAALDTQPIFSSMPPPTSSSAR